MRNDFIHTKEFTNFEQFYENMDEIGVDFFEDLRND